MKRGNGTGSIVKEKGNLRKPWSVRISYKEDGKTKRRRLGYYKTRAEAEKACAEYLDKPFLLKKYFFKDLKEKYIQENNPNRPTLSYLKLLSPLDNLEVNKIKPEDVKALINKQNTDNKKNKVYSLLTSLFKYARFNRLISDNIMDYVKTPKYKPEEREIFTTEEIQKIFESDEPFAYYVKILLLTGMRRGELLSLTPDKINLEKGYICHGSKTDAGRDRIIPIIPELMPLLENYKQYQYNYVNFNNEFINLMQKLNIQNKTPHCCRHTYATILGSKIDNKDYIKRVLGHSSYDFTSKVYTHPDHEEIIQAFSNLTVQPSTNATKNKESQKK